VIYHSDQPLISAKHGYWYFA